MITHPLHLINNSTTIRGGQRLSLQGDVVNPNATIENTCMDLKPFCSIVYIIPQNRLKCKFILRLSQNYLRFL